MIVVTMELLQLDGHGLVLGSLLSPRLKSFNHIYNPRLWASLLGHYWTFILCSRQCNASISSVGM